MRTLLAIGAVLLGGALFAWATWQRWRLRRRTFTQRTQFGGVVKVEVLGPFKRGKGAVVKNGRSKQR